MEDARPARKLMIISGVLIVVLVAGVFGASVVTEFPICTQGSDQYAPAIYGNVVVWADWRNGNYDIYG